MALATVTPSEELPSQRLEYAPALESTDHVKIAPRYQLFVGGRHAAPHSDHQLRAAADVAYRKGGR
jgi:hypothetical protein